MHRSVVGSTSLHSRALAARLVVSVCLAAGVLSACDDDGDSPPPPIDPTVVQTDKGAVQGTATDTMLSFKGIPYAAPPVGALRWMPPASAAAWSDTRDASAFAAHCPQNTSPFGVATATEDCLYLNVYTPTTDGPHPVMVWIHGGAHIYGESDDYDTEALVAQGITVVTINYRLGALGFLAHAALGAENTDGASGNYGLMDQQAALAWVQTNIAAFGGDPAQVTIAGESAGGYSVLLALASPAAAGLFHGAIVESGAYALTQPTLAAAEGTGQTFATTAGCTDQSASCLRGLSVDAILAAQGGTWGPNIESRVLPVAVQTTLTNGTYNKVPVLQGSNAHEYSLLSAVTIDVVLGAPMTAAQYPSQIDAAFGATLGAAVQTAYPLDGSFTPAWTYDNAVTDAVFACSGRSVAQSLAAHDTPVFAYEFADANAPVVFQLPPRPDGFGAYHAGELQYVFPGNQTIYVGAPMTAAQQALSAQMVTYWAQFVTSGDPNGTGSPNWPAYDATTDTYQSLAPGAVAPTTAFSAAHQCTTFWTPGA
jgi:para-nitrobenzyl esterase